MHSRGNMGSPKDLIADIIKTGLRFLAEKGSILSRDPSVTQAMFNWPSLVQIKTQIIQLQSCIETVMS